MVAMILACFVVSNAVPEFKRLCPNSRIVNKRAYLAHWGCAFFQHDGSLDDRPRKGRPQYLTDAEAKKCVKWARKKVWSHGKGRHYFDMAEVGTHLASHVIAAMPATPMPHTPAQRPPPHHFCSPHHYCLHPGPAPRPASASLTSRSWQPSCLAAPSTYGSAAGTWTPPSS